MKTAKYTLLLLLAVFGILWRSLAVFTQDRQRPPRPPPNILGILVGGLDLSDVIWSKRAAAMAEKEKLIGRKKCIH